MSTPKPTISNFEQHWFDGLCATKNYNPKDQDNLNSLLLEVENPQQLQFLLNKGAQCTSLDGVFLLKRIVASAIDSPPNLMMLRMLLDQGGSDLVQNYTKKLNVLPIRNMWFTPKMLTVAFKSGIDWSTFSIVDHKKKSTEMALLSTFTTQSHLWSVLEKLLSYPKAYQQHKDDFLADVAQRVSSQLLPSLSYGRTSKGVGVLNKVLLVASEKERPILSEIIQKNLFAATAVVSLGHQDGLLRLSVVDPASKPIGAAKVMPIHKLIKKSNKSKADIEELIAKKVGVNTITPRQQTFLEEAVLETNIAVCQKLLEAGANPNVVNQRSSVSVLQLACQMKSVPIVKLLLSHGANPSFQAPDGSTPLSSAVQSGVVELVDMLRDQKVDMNVLDAQGGNVLFALAHLSVHQFIPMIHCLITAGANPFIRNNEGQNFVEHMKISWSTMHWKKDGAALGLALDEYMASLSAHDISSTLSSSPSLGSKRKRM